MSWLVAIGLALLCFAVVAFVFRVPRILWSSVLAALALGLAGFAFQARPGLPGAPVPPPTEVEGGGWALVEARQMFIGEDQRSQNPKLVTADAMVRNGRFATAAALAGAAAQENPRDVDAWVALGNALVENAEGSLTPAALYAYRQAAQADPGNLAPGFFIGVGLLRKGRVLEARQAWAAALAAAPQDAPARDELQVRLATLDELLRRIAEQSGDNPATGGLRAR
ncbi:cytochrome C biosynthesis protein [Altericroceibacterium xinjiangense]|uniref:cytochrome C biosynthesis protein n=1 Tax=Altericroceibacterium xinjiangense TaxID=762261 RepID=UPI000F7ED439|nr:cytochrome C biosynthesis protein [Altericroceibacterium xinjiangense]